MTVERYHNTFLWLTILVLAGGLSAQAAAQSLSSDGPMVYRGKNQMVACVAACTSGPCDEFRIEWQDVEGNTLRWEEWDGVPQRGVRVLFYGDQHGDDTSVRCRVPSGSEEPVTAVLERRGRGCDPEVRPHSNCWRVTALANDG